MSKIHLIEKKLLVVCVDKEKRHFESGFWAIAANTATKLIGGDLYLHKSQNQPSFFGGKILSFIKVESGIYQERIVFLIESDNSYKGVFAGNEGWGNEKKILLT